MKHFYIFLLFITSISFGQLTPPDNLKDYYQDVDFDRSGDDLYTEISTNVISKQSTFLSYSQRHQYLYDADEDPNNSDNVILIYSGESRYELEYLSSGNSYNPQTFNTEHVYPRSFVNNTAEADLHHLRTCDIDVNSARGNMKFATGSGTYGEVTAGWYPGDEWRGDVARMIMYMNARYNESFTSVGTLNMFLEWNAADPVSAIEINRNEVISGVQGNRNPFIDNPIIATQIWGGPTAENRWATLSVEDFVTKSDLKIYPNPVSSDYFYVTATADVDVQIYDVLGKKIGDYKITPSNNGVNVSSLNNGLYLVKLKTNNSTISRKLIVQ